MTSLQFLPTVLVVDDELQIAETLHLILRQHGFSVAVAHSGEEAVQQAHQAPPDFLVADILMPGMDGIEAAVQIRTLCPECQVILISGHGSAAEWLETARKAGHPFDSVLAKPFHPTELLALLRIPQEKPQAGPSEDRRGVNC